MSHFSWNTLTSVLDVVEEEFTRPARNNAAHFSKVATFCAGPQPWSQTSVHQERIEVLAELSKLAARYARAYLPQLLHRIRAIAELEVDADRMMFKYHTSPRDGDELHDDSDEFAWAAEAPLYQRLLRTELRCEGGWTYGLVPPSPNWPEVIHSYPRGQDQAQTAYEKLHTSSWFVIFDSSRASFATRLELEKWHDAAVAFADATCGDFGRGYLEDEYARRTLSLFGPQAMLETRPSLDAWSGDSERLLQKAAVQLMKQRDWPAASRVVEHLIETTTNASLRADMLKRRARIALSSQEPGNQSRRPKRLVTPKVGRHPLAQEVVDAAESGDLRARAFLSELKSNPKHLARHPALTEGQMWLLHELDNQPINGYLATRQSAPRELLASIISQVRHAGPRPAISGLLLERAKKDKTLLEIVVEQALDPELISASLVSHRGAVTARMVGKLIERALDLPADTALTILEITKSIFGDTIPPHVRSLLQDAETDALGGPVDRLAIRTKLASLPDLLLTPAPRIAPPQATNLDSASLLAKLQRADSSAEARQELDEWTQLPWDDVLLSLQQDKISPAGARGLLWRDDAPPEVIALALVRAHKDESWGLHPSLAKRHDAFEFWYEALDKSGFADHAVADELLEVLILRDPARWAREVETKPYLVSHVVGELGYADDTLTMATLWEVVLQWARRGVVDPIHVVVNLPYRLNVEFLGAYLDREDIEDLRVRSYEDLPVQLQDWVMTQVRKTVPAGREREEAIERVRSLVGKSNRPLRWIVDQAVLNYGLDDSDEA
jgi:hypothetical protein